MLQHFTNAAGLFLLLLIYSTLGWCGEMIYCSIGQRKLCEKRGFLNGFLCPIYGFGALLVLRALHGGCENPLLTFFWGAILTSAVEYFTSWLMEKLFHMRWWDYSRYKIQLNGRICLLNSTMFGLACVVLCHVAHPRVMVVVRWLVEKKIAVPLAAVLAVVFIADVVLSVRSAIQIGNRLQKLQALQDELQEKLEELRESQRQAAAEYKARLAADRDALRQDLEERRFQAQERLEERKAQAEQRRQELLDNLADLGETYRRRLDQAREEAQERMRALYEGQDFFERRLMRSYPTMRSLRHGEALQKLRQALEERKNQRKKK